MCAKFPTGFSSTRPFQPKALKLKKILEWEMNVRFKYVEIYGFISYGGFYIQTV